MSAFFAEELPFDILLPILSQLTDRRDWNACALVSKLFNRVATPLLYRTLDSRIVSKTTVLHPSTTLLKRPELALHVRHVTETGAVHRRLAMLYPSITSDMLKALATCRNLQSITWSDDCSTTGPGNTLLALLEIVRHLPLREIIIRTHSDLGESVWSQLITLKGLQRVAIWCMEGPPRVLQGWSESLGSSLTHLELGVSAFSYPCSELLSHLPLLSDLRLKGAPAHSIPIILSFLPNLKTLDTEYLPTSSYRRGQQTQRKLPVLSHLTVRASSMDALGPQMLWEWIRSLVPRAGLETFKLHSFAVHIGHMSIPRMFVLDMAQVHAETLRHFVVGEAQLTLSDVECLCSVFPFLESLTCSVAAPDPAAIGNAIGSAKNLHTLRMQAQWMHMASQYEKRQGTFTSDNAMELMLCSQLRVISVGRVLYTGKWVRQEGNAKFVVVADVAEDKWHP